MEIAPCLSMKAHCIALILVSLTLVALACMLVQQQAVETPLGQALEGSAMSAESLPPGEMPRLVEAPVAAESPREPVQSLEERGDAMLFEGEALVGTPFDQPVVMPFD